MNGESTAKTNSVNGANVENVNTQQTAQSVSIPDSRHTTDIEYDSRYRVSALIRCRKCFCLISYTDKWRHTSWHISKGDLSPTLQDGQSTDSSETAIT